MALQEKKYVLITGCSEGGIGASLALAFQQTGRYHVFATARNTSKIPKVLTDDSDNVTILALDVTSKDSISFALGAVSSKTNAKLDVLINNSGMGMIGQPAIDTDMDTARAMFNVNYFGVLAVTQAFIPLLVRAKGVIINNSSVAGEKSVMYNSIYSSTKAAVTMWTECLRLELAALEVRVIVLITGIVETSILANAPPVNISNNSLYAPIAGFLKKVPEDASLTKGTSAETFAQQVLRAIEDGASGKVWLGAMSSIARSVAWWIPDFIWDRINYQRNPEQYKLTEAAAKWRE